MTFYPLKFYLQNFKKFLFKTGLNLSMIIYLIRSLSVFEYTFTVSEKAIENGLDNRYHLERLYNIIDTNSKSHV